MLSTIKDNLDRIVDEFRLVEKYGDDGAKKIIGSIKSNLLIKVDNTNDRLEELKNDLLDFYIEEEVDEIFVDDSGWSLRVFL